MPFLVPKLCLGTHGREALLRLRVHRSPTGSRASKTCVPKQSLGTRRGNFFMERLDLAAPSKTASYTTTNLESGCVAHPASSWVGKGGYSEAVHPLARL